MIAARFARTFEGLEPARVRAMVGITVTSFGITLGIGIIFPLMPIFARDLGISITAVGSLVGAFGVARIAIGLFGGPIFARLSERTVAAAGAGTVAVGSLLTAYATDFSDLLLARVIHGFGVALFVVAGLVYIGRAFPPSQRGRLMSLHQGSMLLATSVGPVVGAFLASFGGVRLPFLVAAAFGAGGFAYAVRSFPSSGPVGEALPTAREVSWNGWRWTVAVMLLASFVTWGMRSAMRFTLTPIFITEELGSDLVWSGVVLAIMSVGDIVGLVFGGRWMDGWGRSKVFVGGSALTAGSIALFPLAGSIPVLVMLAVVFGVVGGLCAAAPAAMAADLSGGNATVMTSSRVAGDVGVLVGPMGSSALLDQGGFGIGYGSVAMASAVAALAAATARETLAFDGEVEPDTGPVARPVAPALDLG